MGRIIQLTGEILRFFLTLILNFINTNTSYEEFLNSLKLSFNIYPYCIDFNLQQIFQKS